MKELEVGFLKFTVQDALDAVESEFDSQVDLLASELQRSRVVEDSSEDLALASSEKHGEHEQSFFHFSAFVLLQLPFLLLLVLVKSAMQTG